MKRFLIACSLLVLCLSFVVFALFPGSRASAASGLITKGDVEKIVHAPLLTGGNIPFHKNPVGPFGEALTFASIDPQSFANGAHYCVDDWHAVTISDIDIIDNVFFFTKEQAIADLQATTVTLTVDGVNLPFTQTPITQLDAAQQQRDGFPGPVYGFQVGGILSPTALSVGDHTAGFVATDPVFGTLTDSSTFTVDASGTGVCLQSR